MTHSKRVLRVGCIGTLLLGALPAPASAQIGLFVSAKADLQLFEGLIQGLPALHVGGRLEVYTHPITSRDELPYPPTDDVRVPITVDLAARARYLADLSIREARTLSVGACPGLLTGNATSPPCPSEWVTMVAFGLPRLVADAKVPEWKGAGRVVGRRADVVVRVLFVTLTPHGSMVASADYYVARDEFGWEVVARRVLGQLH